MLQTHMTVVCALSVPGTGVWQLTAHCAAEVRLQLKPGSITRARGQSHPGRVPVLVSGGSFAYTVFPISGGSGDDEPSTLEFS